MKKLIFFVSFVQEPPVVKTYWAKEEAENDYKWQVWHSIGTGCPDGSIPIQRRLSHPNKTPDPRDVNKDHEVKGSCNI